MRASILAAAGVLAASRLLGAAPDPRPPTSTWADWAGGYTGTLTWSGCTAAGARTPTLALDFLDGVATIDLAPAHPGMRALTLVADEGDKVGWSARQGDVAVTIAAARQNGRPVSNTLELAIDLDSGCTVRGRLTRKATGVAACDRLLGWARIDARCTKQPAPTEDLARLLATIWKPADAARCTARAATLERSLIDIGCAPHPDPKIGVRSPDCLELSQVASRISRCSSVLPQIKDLAVATAHAVVSASQTAEKATLPYVEQQCRDTRAELIAIATKFGCP